MNTNFIIKLLKADMKKKICFCPLNANSAQNRNTLNPSAMEDHYCLIIDFTILSRQEKGHHRIMHERLTTKPSFSDCTLWK